MRSAITFALLCAASSPLWAQNRVTIPAAEFARVLKRADPELLVDVDRSAISAKTVRVIRCIGPEEEPTEFQCRWQLRTKRGWRTHENWLAIDRDGWLVIG